MRQPDPPRPRKRPKQGRSQLLVQSIQQACLNILEQEGPDRLSTQRIADVAGVNIASLYQYFPNKEAILTEVFEEQIQQLTELASSRFAQIDRLSRESLEETLAAIVDMEIEQRLSLHRMDPAFYRAYQHSFDVHRRVSELTVAMDNPAWETWFPRFLSYHAGQLRSNDLQALGQVARLAFMGTIIQAEAEDPGLLSQESFREELLKLLLSYLRA
ncbi:MAG: hypothetical protein CME59_00980 [Halioglobus sp.]|nr:hypothetical protein [Halioglobus sp.]|tara:strand:- start:901 stop:1545 length:645 start_codon:yes stop_codon:yes gene_type:complete